MANATIRVQFGNPDGSGGPGGSGASGHLSAEVDTRAAGLNGGRSSFSPGETVYILIYKSDNVSHPDGHPNSPTCGHLKLPHPERGVTMG